VSEEDRPVTGPGRSPVELLKDSGASFSVLEHVPIIGQEDVERELGLPASQLLKTMDFRANETMILVALPVHGRVNYGRLARATGISRGRIRQAGPDDLRLLGMEVGGASPVCDRDGVITVFDDSVPQMGTVFCGSGRCDQTVEIEASALVDIARPVIAPVTAE
jgi:Cys-tRNA(Pro)/Cys-tRNA(Cys) deacylase